ncbi:hypothetical protein FKM82_021938 [Ascaphus truei]
MKTWTNSTILSLPLCTRRIPELGAGRRCKWRCVQSQLVPVECQLHYKTFQQLVSSTIAQQSHPQFKPILFSSHQITVQVSLLWARRQLP